MSFWVFFFLVRVSKAFIKSTGKSSERFIFVKVDEKVELGR